MPAWRLACEAHRCREQKRQQEPAWPRHDHFFTDTYQHRGGVLSDEVRIDDWSLQQGVNMLKPYIRRTSDTGHRSSGRLQLAALG